MPDVARLWAEYAPRIAEEKQRDAEAQDEVFLGFPVTLGDRTVNPLTVEKFLLLECLGNRFVVDGTPTAEDVASFLWVLSPDFDPNPKKGKRAMRRFKAKKWQTYVAPIMNYLKGVAEFSTGRKSGSPSAWVAALVDLLAHQYHWSRKEIMATPMAQVFQLASRIRGRVNQSSVEFSPRAAALQSEFMEKAKEFET